MTIANRKTITTAPACASIVTPAEIGRLTGTAATQEPEDKGFCGFTLTRSGTPAGVVLVVLTQAMRDQSAERTTFEGNTAYHLTTTETTCDLYVALTDDQTAPYRVLWVSVVLTGPTEPICTTADKLAKSAFAKLPAG